MREQKILYAIQATGNGHLARAQEIIPHLKNYAEVDILVSGTQSNLTLPVKPDFYLEGLSFCFGKDGGINFRETFLKTIVPQFKLRVIQELYSIPINQYDWILHDFEPISAWSARIAGVPAAQLSHQASFLSSKTPRAKPGSMLTEFILSCAAPSNFHIGLHYQEYDQQIRTPIIRKAIRELDPRNDGHYVVYLPAYSDQYLVPLLQAYPRVEWHIFNRHHQQQYIDKNVTVMPVSENEFLRSFESCEGIITGGGFQSTSEAIFLGKKLLVVPQRHQYEQHCNVEALKRLGVPSITKIDRSTTEFIRDWMEFSLPLQIIFPDETEALVDSLVASMEEITGHDRGPSRSSQSYPRKAA